MTVENGSVKVEDITFSIDGATYTGKVKGNRIEGVVKAADRETAFSAERSSR